MTPTCSGGWPPPICRRASVAFRPDGRQLAIANGDLRDPGRVRLVDADTFEEVPVQLGGVSAPSPSLAAWDLNYSSDGRSLAGLFELPGTDDFKTPAEAVVWDLAAPEQPIQRIETDDAWGAALSPDGQRLYVGSWQLDPQLAVHRPTISVYDVITGRRLRSVYEPYDPRYEGQMDRSDQLAVSPDGTTVAAVDGGEVVLLDASTLALQRRLTGPPEHVQTVEFSRDGTMVASGSDHGTVLVWDVAAGTRREELHGDAGPVSDLAFSPDDTILYSAADKLLAWDLRGDHGFVQRIVQPERDDSLSSRAIPAPDGEAVAYFANSSPVAHHSTIQFRNVATGRLGEPIVTATENVGAAWRPPEAEQFATTDGEGFVRVWNWRRNALVAQRKVADGPIEAIAYSKDGRRIVVGERSGAVFQVDADTLEPIGRRIDLAAAVQQVLTTPDPRTALVVLTDGSSAQVDLVDGSIVKTDLGVAPTSAAISPDGTRLAVGTAKGQVGVADIRTGEWVRPLAGGHGGWVQTVAWAPDGNTLVSSGNDGQVEVWDSRTGEPPSTITPGTGNVWAAGEFLPDGHTVLVATRDGAVYTWDTRVDQWIAFACRVAGRNLTTAEWRDAFANRPYRQTCP